MGEAKLYTDGGARGNPGPAGIGFVLLDSDDKLLAEEGRYIGEATNNVAEYRALLLGLEWALARGIDRLEVYSDSELMVRQLKGEYKVRNDGLIPLYQEALRIPDQREPSCLAQVAEHSSGSSDQQQCIYSLNAA
jgi:ribonuclease HI